MNTAKPVLKVGGQAIIEGVMMRSKHSYSMAVRRLSGEIVMEKREYTSLVQRYRVLGWPLLRGFIQLYESLVIGMKALNFSAEIAGEDENDKLEIKKEKTFWSSLATGGTIAFSFAVAIGIFMYLPMLISSFVAKEENPLLFNAVAGFFRILFFLIYLYAISFWKDIRRVFEYHGAEHKSIFAFEDGLELTVENADKYHTHHPRCGTSILLIVGLVCILLFAVVDGAVAVLIAPYKTLLHRLVVHLMLIPLVSGVSYEVLKLSDKYQHLPLISWSIKPGLWLQRITTKPPNREQLEVAITALKAVL